jgi:isoamylase
VPPPPMGQRWVRMLDTAAPPPRDICLPGQGVAVDAGVAVNAEDRSLVVLVAEA